MVNGRLMARALQQLTLTAICSTLDLAVMTDTKYCYNLYTLGLGFKAFSRQKCNFSFVKNADLVKNFVKKMQFFAKPI